MRSEQAGVSHADIWRKGIPGGRESKCKVPEVGPWQAWWRTIQDPNMTGMQLVRREQ